MKKTILLLKTMLLAVVVMAGSANVWGQKTYSLVTSAGNLVVGGKYLVVGYKPTATTASTGRGGTNPAGWYALGFQKGSGNGTNRDAIVVASGTTLPTSLAIQPAAANSEESAAFEITLAGSSGAWVLYDAANSSNLGPSKGNTTNNYLMKSTAAPTFTITIAADSKVTMTCFGDEANTNGTPSRNIVRFNVGQNTSDPLFACYASGQADIYLYKLGSDPTDATLSDLKVNGVTVNGFDPKEDVYEYVLPYSATTIPGITWTTSNPNATAEITTEATISEFISKGSSIAVITVTPVSGTTKDYYIKFVRAAPSADATLKSLKVGGDAITLVSGQFEYDFVLPYGTAVMPTITAETKFEYATIDWVGAVYATIAGIIDGTNDETIFEVIAEDGISTELYAIKFSIATTPSPAVLAAWQFGTPASAGNEVTYNATTIHANLNPSVLSRGNGIVAASLVRAFSANDWITGAGATKAAAVSNNEYFEITITPQTDFEVSLSTLDARLRRTSTGPNAYIWKYSVDGNLFYEIGTDVSFTSTDDGVNQSQIDLASIADLQSVKSTVYLRLYAWGASGTTGTFAIGRYGANDTTNSLSICGFVDFSTNLNNLFYSNIKAYSANSAIHLSNLPESATIYMYNVAGQLVTFQKAGASSAILPIAPKGIYLVKVVSTKGVQTLKVVNK